MESIKGLDFNPILGRSDQVLKFKNILQDFNVHKTDLSVKRGIYVYGEPGCGKTEFVTRILNEMRYDIIRYDAGDIRNKTVIDTITKHNMSDQSVMSIFEKLPKRIVIVMDEIDGMNTGDKGGITSLIKLIRPKKTKKQKTEDYTLNPIICIGNYEMDKKIKEIMKVCHIIELRAPTMPQMRALVGTVMPDMQSTLADKITAFTQCDIRKLMTVCNIYDKDKSIINSDVLDTIFRPKSCSENSKLIVRQLLNSNYSISDHAPIVSETDRTIIGLLWHENITDNIVNDQAGSTFYHSVLNNICFADYIDRITFQKQIWIFNEMSSLIKTFYNNALYHQFKNKTSASSSSGSVSVGCSCNNNNNNASDEIRFTKVLTKYSTEYNNLLFIQHLCNQLLMDRKDLVEFFGTLRTDKAKMDNISVSSALFEQYEITKLDVERMYRYIDKFSTIEGGCSGMKKKKGVLHDCGYEGDVCDDEYDGDANANSYFSSAFDCHSGGCEYDAIS
jgi:hypothetical protein